MKKLLTALLCTGLIAVTVAGCGYSDPLIKDNSATSASESDKSEATADEVKDSKYKNNLDGIVKYFKANEYIEDIKTFVEMDAKSIGATSGKKFSTKYEGKNVTIELYEYNTKALDKTAKDTISSIKESGTFTVYNLAPVKAYLSDNGKFLMIYTDESINKENPDKTTNNYKHRESVIKNFKAFHKNDK